MSCFITVRYSTLQGRRDGNITVIFLPPGNDFLRRRSARWLSVSSLISQLLFAKLITNSRMKGRGYVLVITGIDQLPKAWQLVSDHPGERNRTLQNVTNKDKNPMNCSSHDAHSMMRWSITPQLIRILSTLPVQDQEGTFFQ
ncbi:hypothetical protein J6590_001626 [Homalodisca vitripennis]|nr:hypothetical protein J6590_001626 [Homalodisca vitripennis]